MISELIIWVTIILTIISIFIVIKDQLGIGSFLLSITVVPVLIFLVTTVIGVLIAGGIAVSAKKVEVCKYITPIYCFNDDTKIEGKSYLRSGYINQILVYRTMYIDEYGGKKQWELDANKCSVFEDDKKEVIAFGLKYENPNIDYWIKGLNVDNLNNETRYEVHIPKGSIVEKFNIDLK